jgi:hypothetical protein
VDVFADTHPTSVSRIEQSFSSVSITIATSESGRKNAARWFKSTSSLPMR